MILIDASVNEPDDQPGTRLGGDALQQVNVGIGPIGVDRFQTPLVIKAQIVIAVLRGKPRRLDFKICT